MARLDNRSQRFLLHVFERYRKLAKVRIRTIGDDLRLAYDEALEAFRSLEDEGLAERAAAAGFFRLTPAGRREAGRLLEGLPELESDSVREPSKLDRIVSRIARDLQPALDEEERWGALQAFLGVVRAVVRYLVVRAERPEPFLKAAESGGPGAAAREAELEESLLGFLEAWDNHQDLGWQLRVANGRVDLSVRTGGFFFPIEVKKETRDCSEAHLQAAYLPQVATYVRAHHRLGLLVVLDLTEKSKGALPDLENLVRLHEVRPRTGPAEIPVYIVSCIVQGNLPVPSSL